LLLKSDFKELEWKGIISYNFEMVSLLIQDYPK